MDEFGSSFKNDDQRALWIATFKTYGKRLLGDGMSGDDLLAILGIDRLPSPIEGGVSIFHENGLK